MIRVITMLTALHSSLALSLGSTRVFSCTHPNGMREFRVEGGEPEMYDELSVSLAEISAAAPGVLLSIGNAPACGDGAAQLLQNRQSANAQAILRRLALQGRPVISIAEETVSGAAAGLWMAASHRVCTHSTMFSLPECRVGLCPASAPVLCRLGTEPHIAMYVALSGAQLTAHDCASLQLATHCAQADQMPDLLNELRRCPAASFPMLVPLLRRTEPAPSYLASLFALGVGPSINATLLEVFGEAADAADCALRLRAALERARALTQSSAWRTRECADAVVDILDSADKALRASSPSALAATFDMMRSCASSDLVTPQELAITTDEREST
jgi:enoyl-CoA hydratase/carnithine racemase